ncbi:glycerophosphodiester phosphodiesterase family protein [Enterobacteriaceae bacterium ESL0689]|nr:glycerophosphodiester phosphodiesterase family protein [Enterobacteriaceae bacterium ESL0689]
MKVVGLFFCFLFMLLISSYIYMELIISTLNKNDIVVIAHSGGEIDGHIYTNSLEALNHSYLQGARNFELDIRETKDHHLVAVHGWEQWAEFTGYTDELPPSLDDFKKNKIFGKYTGIDFADINQWFSQHQDATLITDKIDVPQRITSLFCDKNRLKMELFS